MLDVQIRKRLATGRKSGDSFSLDVSLSCATRRLVLFGHSGSGKTLTLQSLAGLVRPDGGYIKIGDDVLYASEKGIDLPARERHLGYVFQDYALFPHLTVKQNITLAPVNLKLQTPAEADEKAMFKAVVNAGYSVDKITDTKE